jgi:hypothetical protein
MHIVCFNLSAIFLIAQIPILKRDIESILPFGDDLSFGPVTDVTGVVRQGWNRELMQFLHSFSHQEIEQMWSANLNRWEFVRTKPDKLQIWLTRNAPNELCGFGEFLCSIPEGQEFEIVDFAEASLNLEKESVTVRSIGELNLAQLESGLSRRSRSSTRDWSKLISQWKKLKTMGPALRFVKQGLLNSTPETHFDSRIMASLSDHWLSTSKLIGNLMFELEDESTVVTWDLLTWRLHEFLKLGTVEFQETEGSPFQQVRLAPRVD